MKQVHILWTDDEIDLLKPHILFLNEKGYSVTTASNGADAVELVRSEDFDLVFLDENMPGMSGLETLNKIKEDKPGLPVVMITKSEEEDIMDAAIGSKIADYLIKPVNPNQILLSIKKNIDNKALIKSKTTSAYQVEFGNIGMLLSSATSFEDWAEIYKKLIYWELELDNSQNNNMYDVFRMQKTEADVEFSKFIKRNYVSWLKPDSKKAHLLSPHIFSSRVFPEMNEHEKLVFLLIDNLRFDQWRVIQPLINEFYQTEEEMTFCSILPTSTQYSRNAIFSGLMPESIQKMFSKYWKKDDEEGNKNEFEEKLLEHQLKRYGVKAKLAFEKIYNNRMGEKILERLSNILQNDLIVLVYNFVDMLSHANTDLEMIRELAVNDSAYRSLTLSWFRHSNIMELLKELSEKKIPVILTTDHGTIRVNRAIKVIGDKSTSKNLRYKLGKNLSYDTKDVYEIVNPSDVLLPRSTVSSRYIFALNNDFIAYPNNYNYYVKYYTNTYQHGGISMEEMILPLVKLRPKEL
ncbi:MAG: bifunctional response regulator/alkaline phosphatase family protein [Bacteroidales bacterium]|jgi:CheY-like chemotaxis protein